MMMTVLVPRRIKALKKTGQTEREKEQRADADEPGEALIDVVIEIAGQDEQSQIDAHAEEDERLRPGDSVHLLFPFVWRGCRHHLPLAIRFIIGAVRILQFGWQAMLNPSNFESVGATNLVARFAGIRIGRPNRSPLFTLRASNPIPRPLPQRAKEGELNLASAVYIPCLVHSRTQGILRGRRHCRACVYKCRPYAASLKSARDQLSDASFRFTITHIPEIN